MSHAELGIARSLVWRSYASKQDDELAEGRIFPHIDAIFVLLKSWGIRIEELDVAVRLWTDEAAQEEWRGLWMYRGSVSRRRQLE